MKNTLLFSEDKFTFFLLRNKTIFKNKTYETNNALYTKKIYIKTKDTDY